MTKMIMMIGVSGSGKSTYAKQLAGENADKGVMIASSDSIREELYGFEDFDADKNKEVFEELHKRMFKALDLGVNVIYDATNLSSRRRKHLLSQIPKGVEKIAVYMHTPKEEILKNDYERENPRGADVILQQYKTLQLPLESEGWDEIIFNIHHTISDLPDQTKMGIRAGVTYREYGYSIMRELSRFFKPFTDILELPHDSKYHTYSVSRHTYHVYQYMYQYLADTYNSKDKKELYERELLLWVALLHDLGKHECKSFVNHKGEETNHANFINHENVSAQLAVTILTELGFSESFIKQATTLIQYHMRLLNQNANLKKLEARVGKENLEYLKILRDADNSAH